MDISTLKEKVCTAIAAFCSGTIATALGGWDSALEILMIFIIIDYVTGVGAAIKNKALRSDIGFSGILKKGCILVVIIVAVQLDRIMGNHSALFRTSTCFFFIANEGLSILENVDEIGLRLPTFIRKMLEKLQNNNDDVPMGDDDEQPKDTNHKECP